MQQGIEITTRFPPGAYYFHLCRPRVVIDGQITKERWGTKFFNLERGTHTIEIYFRYLWMRKCGRNEIEVIIGDSEVRGLDFYMPPLMFLRGKMTLT